MLLIMHGLQETFTYYKVIYHGDKTKGERARVPGRFRNKKATFSTCASSLRMLMPKCVRAWTLAKRYAII